MLIRRNPPRTGYCFAWLPVWTPEGKVWLEHVRFKYHEHGLGGIDYERLLTPRGESRPLMPRDLRSATMEACAAMREDRKKRRAF